MAKNPKVFISYSHDSSNHKQWVAELGTKLRHNGVDVILDQWDLGLGDDVTRFMEVGVRDSDRVLVVCTDTYVRKANEREGGVGYEQLIVTAQIVQNIGTKKFIPIIRQASGEEKTPTFLETRVYIDFTDDNQLDEKADELLHELHKVAIVKKPPLGKNPFAKIPSGEEAPTTEDLPDIPKRVESASDSYLSAIEIARAGDTLGWRQFLKSVRPTTFKSLVQWRQKELDNHAPERERLVQVVDKAVDIVSPLISIALVGVESGREQFVNQKSLLDDLLNVPNWRRQGYDLWISIPDVLGYVYHSLHGALSLNTGQVDIALSLAQTKIPLASGTFLHVWQRGTLMGYSELLSGGSTGGNCIKGWKWLSSAYERWEWLSPIFEDESEYRTALVAYYMALNVHELAVEIASGRQDALKNFREDASNPFDSPLRFNVPLNFFSEEQEINRRATSLLQRNPKAMAELWISLSVTHEQMKSSWKYWIHLCEHWVSRAYALLDVTPINNAYKNLFEV